MFASVTFPVHAHSLKLLVTVIAKGLWHIISRKDSTGETSLDGLNVLMLDYFKGNIWAGETKLDLALFFDERANEEQRKALNMIFTGKAGGFMRLFANIIGEVRGLQYVPIKFEVAGISPIGVRRYQERLSPRLKH